MLRYSPARAISRTILTAALLHVLGACASTAPPPAAPAAAWEFEDEYRIGVGDRLSIVVWRNAELSVAVPVRPDGKISVPLTGDIMAGGKTPEEVGAVIRERLLTFVRDPNVTVIVTDMASHQYRSRVRVTGAVLQPVSLQYRQGMTVLDLVLDAGGLTEFANGGKSRLFRRDGERLEVDLDRILSRGDMSTNYALRPGDVISVPERLF
jgi:polysaccharide export outer membrane protein